MMNLRIQDSVTMTTNSLTIWQVTVNTTIWSLNLGDYVIHHNFSGVDL